MGQDLSLIPDFHGYHGRGWARGHPTFNGIHNRTRFMLYYTLHLYHQLYLGGRGLTANELTQLVGLTSAAVLTALTKATSQRFIRVHLERSKNARGYYRLYRHHTIDAQAETWLEKYDKFIPWERWEMDLKGKIELRQKIEALVAERGHK